MCCDYIQKIHKKFRASDETQSLFEKIIKTPKEKKGDILKDLYILIKRAGLAYGLIALFRQQVNCGFVLGEPLIEKNKEEKGFFDLDTGITFRVKWNPDRELRKEHDLLINRGVISENVDQELLINRNKGGKACYLCEKNIELQNPAEIVIKLDLAGDKYCAGANFAYITNNHFTIMSAEHRPQKYSKKIIEVLNDFIDQTDGYFRAIFNGLAGASIEEHEHLQATTEKFPIEEIKIENKDIIKESSGIKVSRPSYYMPVWVVEGTDKTKIVNRADDIIKKWHGLDEHHHTENIISTKIGKKYKTFIIFRDKRKLAGAGKTGHMASFECGGSIVLSHNPNIEKIAEIDERETFNNADLGRIKRLLRNISPNSKKADLFLE